MEFRALGHTGEKLSTIGMGTWRIGVYRNSEERAQQVAAIRRGIELGINHIDTAEMYAAGRSEEVVGEAVHENRNNIFIASKVSPENLHYDDVLSSCEDSLSRLGTDYIDLYQVHWPNPSIPIAETMRAMEELVRNGKVRFVGVSNFNVRQTEEARDALSREDLVSNQVEYSLTNRSPERDVLPYCKKEKLTLIAYSPLSRGHISSNRIPKSILEKYDVTPAQAALNWVTRDESVVAIPKSASIPHLEENASAVSARYSAEDYKLIAGA